MKIVIYSHDFLPILGGVPIVSRILADGLTTAGHEVVIFTTTLADDRDAERPYRVVRSSWWPRLFTASRGADVILANGFSRRAGLVSLLTKKPLVIIHQMADKPDDRAHRQSSSLSAFVERKSFAAAAHHIGVSEACLTSKDLPPTAQTAVVYNPIDPTIVTAKETLDASPPIEKTYDLLFAGRLIDGKGVHVLMAALRRLDDEGRPLRVCMAGSGDAAARLRGESALLKHVRVDFPGALDRVGMARAYATSRIFVIPSSTHQEGMPLVVAEALHFGLPVIGSDQEMILEGIGEAGLHFESGNVAHLTDQIRRLTEEETLHTHLSTAARTRSALFLPNQFLSSVQAILHKASQGNRPQATEDDLSPETVRRVEPVNQ